MIKAYPIDSEGNQIGKVFSFDDIQWEKMQKIKELRWKKVDEIKEISADEKESEKVKPIKKQNEK